MNDSVATAAAAAAAAQESSPTHRIGVGSTTIHVKKRGLMGCHMDLGYDHPIRGVYTQLLHGESFEPMQVPQPTLRPDGGSSSAAAAPAATFNTSTQWTSHCGATLAYTKHKPFNGEQSLRLTTAVGADAAGGGATNRGFWSEGLALKVTMMLLLVLLLFVLLVLLLLLLLVLLLLLTPGAEGERAILWLPVRARPHGGHADGFPGRPHLRQTLY